MPRIIEENEWGGASGKNRQAYPLKRESIPTFASRVEDERKKSSINPSSPTF
jgi:hypothetical protein